MIILIPAYEPSMRLVDLIVGLRRRSAFAAPAAAEGAPVAPASRAVEATRVIVVDDGSGNAYSEVFARAVEAGAEVLAHLVNRGKGAALKTGFSYALERYPGEGVVTADADGQHTVDDILAVAEDVRVGDGRTMILGCRGFDGTVPLRSRVGNGVSRSIFRTVAGWRLSDTQTGLRGVPVEMLPWLLGVPGDRFEYEQRALLGLRKAGFTARERRIDTVYIGENESSHFRPVLDSIRVMLPMLTFAASSIIGFLVDTVALFVFDALTGMLVPSIIAARVLSASTNFWVNRRVVFLKRGRDGLWKQVIFYAGLAGILLASNIVWMSYLTGDLGWPLWVAKVVTELVLFVTSYRVQRGAIFGEGSASVSGGDGASASGGDTVGVVRAGSSSHSPALRSAGPAATGRIIASRCG